MLEILIFATIFTAQQKRHANAKTLETANHDAIHRMLSCYSSERQNTRNSMSNTPSTSKRGRECFRLTFEFIMPRTCGACRFIERRCCSRCQTSGRCRAWQVWVRADIIEQYVRRPLRCVVQIADVTWRFDGIHASRN